MVRQPKTLYKGMGNRIYSAGKVNKYHNRKITIDGITFDSKKEGKYYLTLKSLEKFGLIKELELQKKFILQDSFKLNGKTKRAITYIADFYYYDIKDQRYRVVDVKGSYNTMTEVFKIKKKLFEYKYKMELEIIV